MTTTDIVAGLRFPAGCSPLGRFAVARGTDKLEQGMRLILQTYPGERVMRPDFGSRLRDFLFEAITPATTARLADEVARAIGAWEPRVEVERVDTSADAGADGLLHIVVGYRVRATGEAAELVVDFRTDRHPSAGGN
ncbi:GPW/gp25 family protein [Kribbella sp. NPDC056861]|uniref:GPW/gp25 family protein n=1 Tax=Kribbella sp. NPDC056861 TaxID=3154857 RepID=UPI00342DD1D2